MDDVEKIPQLVSRLRDLLDAKFVAYIASAPNTGALQECADGSREPSAEVAARLQVAYFAVALMREQDSPAVVQALFQGMNPRLEDVAPARLPRDGDLRVLAALRARMP